MTHYIDRLAMVSTHGYFEARPQLGKADTGGQITYVLELALGLMRLGVDVDIFSRRFGDFKEVEIVAKEAGHMVRIVRIPAGGDAFIPKEEFFSITDQLRDNIIAWINKEGITYNAFHGHYWDGGIIASDLAKFFNVHHFWTPHSLGSWKRASLLQGGMSEDEVEEKFKLNSRVAVENEIISSAKHVIAISDSQKKDFSKYTRFPQGKLVTVPAGVNLRRFTTKKNAFDEMVSLPNHAILAVSRFVAAKRLDLLVKAFAYVAERRPNARLVLGGGSDAPEPEEVAVRQQLKQLINELGLKDVVYFAGYIAHDTFLPAYYRATKVFTLYSSFEPFGLTALEAMACGTPVIASKHAGVADLVSEAGEMKLVDPANSKEFGQAVLQLLDEDDLRDRQRQIGLKLVNEKYSWEKVAAQHLALHKQYVLNSLPKVSEKKTARTLLEKNATKTVQEITKSLRLQGRAFGID